MFSQCGSRFRGFTLVEMMVVIAILGIALGIAIPNLRDLLVESRLRKSANDLYLSMVFARSEAINRNSPITITPVSSDWKNGWQVTVVISGVASLLRSGDAFPVEGPSIPSPASIVLSAEGRPSGSVVFVVKRTDKTPSSIRCVGMRTTGLPFNKSDTVAGNCSNV